MEWGNYGVYNRPMSQSRTTTGILTIIVLAVIGYVLVTVPPRLFEGYHNAPEVQKEIAAAVEELESKRQAQQLEIVAFGTISSGKSSLLNALAGRQMFRTNVVGGTTVSRSEIPWPAGDRVVLIDTPGLAEV